MVLNSNTLVRMSNVQLKSSALLVKCTCQLSYWWLDWLGIRGWLRAQLDKLLAEKRRKLSGCCFSSQFLTKTDNKSGTLSRFFVVLSSEAKVVLDFTPSYLRGDCNTAQWETHLQVRNKEVCFAYQLLTTSRVAFGCCLWFCRCMPPCGSMVMGPFPRKLHWNILTVTFA